MVSVNIQPSDLRKILDIRSDSEYELVVKSYRFLFDILCCVEEGSSVTTGMVSWIKGSSDDILAVSPETSFSAKVVTEIRSDVLFKEMSDAVSKASEIILPV